MKRSSGLRALSSEHHTALTLARRAALAAESDNVTNAWSDVEHSFETELEIHFRQEERLLLPALADAGETVLVQRTLAEHAQLRALVYGQARDAETLRSFAELLQAHVRFEERELFEIAQARLPEFSITMPS